MKVREAKDFLVRQIADEAQAQGKPLSDLERRMFYFTESNDAIEDPAALNAEFAAQYDSAEYELKVARLIRNAHKRIKREDPEGAHGLRRFASCVGAIPIYSFCGESVRPVNVQCEIPSNISGLA